MSQIDTHRWTYEKQQEIEKYLSGLYTHEFPAWEVAVREEVLDKYRCSYCTSKESVKIVAVAYLKWIVVYFVCPNCDNTRVKTIKNVDDQGRLGLIHMTAGVKASYTPKIFYSLFHIHHEGNPIYISRDYLRSKSGRGRPAKYNLRRVDAEIFKASDTSGLFTKYGWDTALIHEKVNREFKRNYSRRLIYSRLIDMEVRGIFWRMIRYGKYFWRFKLEHMDAREPQFREMGMITKSVPGEGTIGYHAVDIDDNLIAEQDNLLQSKVKEFIRWKELEKRNKALIESLNFA